MTELEQFVVEAAIEWAMWREGVHYGPGQKQLWLAERALEKAVSCLQNEHDGQWRPAEHHDLPPGPRSMLALGDEIMGMK